MINIEQVKKRYIELHEELLELFEGVNQEDPSAENLRFVLRRFIDNEDKQLYFSGKYNRVKSLFEFLAPDPFLKPYVRSFEWLTSVYLAFSKEFKGEDDSHLLKDFGQKVRQLVNDNVEYDLSERIKGYKDLLDDIKSAHDEAESSGMPLKTYSLYLLTKDFSGDTDDDIVREYVSELTQRLDDQVLDVNWQESSKYDLFIKNVKRAILELTLKDYRERLSISDFSKFQNRITDAVIKTFK
jgi:hypothetical protein